MPASLTCTSPLSRREADATRISSAVLSYSTFGNRFGAVAQLVPISDDACHADSDSSWVIDWARQTLCSCLDACKSKGLGKDDGPAMLDAALYFQDPHGFLLQTSVSSCSPCPISMTS